MKRFATLFALLLGVGILVALYIAGWTVLARVSEQQLDRFATSDPKGAQPIHYTTRHTNGFPLAVRIRLSGVRLSGADGSVLTAPDVRLTAVPWRITHVDMRARNGLVFAPAPASAAGAKLALSAGLMTGAVDYVVNSPALTTAATLTTVTLGPADAGPQAAPLKAESAEIHFSQPAMPSKGGDDTAGSGSLVLHHLQLPDTGEDNPLGTDVEELALAAELKGPAPAKLTQNDLQAWRKAGGILNIGHVGLHWGELQVDGSGTLALDDDLQPQLASTLQVRGLPEIIDKLVVAEKIDPQQAAMAKMILMALAANAGTQNPVPPAGALVVPLTIENLQLEVMGAPIAQLSPITWPGAATP